MGVFAVLQLARFGYAGDSVLTGQGRVLALHMFEARQECEVAAIVSGRSQPIDLRVNTLPPRMICDPVVYFNRAQNLCRDSRQTDAAFDFRLLMNAKRATDVRFTSVINAPGFCGQKYTYDIFRNNAWLMPEDAEPR